jgi:hypothetical protein
MPTFPKPPPVNAFIYLTKTKKIMTRTPLPTQTGLTFVGGLKRERTSPKCSMLIRRNAQKQQMEKQFA